MKRSFGKLKDPVLCRNLEARSPKSHPLLMRVPIHKPRPLSNTNRTPRRGERVKEGVRRRGKKSYGQERGSERERREKKRERGADKKREKDRKQKEEEERERESENERDGGKQKIKK